MRMAGELTGIHLLGALLEITVGGNRPNFILSMND